MNYKEFEHLLDRIVAKEKEIGKTKAVEYTQNDDRLDNFKRLAKELGLAPEQILSVYLKKHLADVKMIKESQPALF